MAPSTLPLDGSMALVIVVIVPGRFYRRKHSLPPHIVCLNYDDRLVITYHADTGESSEKTVTFNIDLDSHITVAELPGRYLIIAGRCVATWVIFIDVINVINELTLIAFQNVNFWSRY